MTVPLVRRNPTRRRGRSRRPGSGPGSAGPIAGILEGPMATYRRFPAAKRIASPALPTEGAPSRNVLRRLWPLRSRPEQLAPSPATAGSWRSSLEEGQRDQGSLLQPHRIAGAGNRRSAGSRDNALDRAGAGDAERGRRSSRQHLADTAARIDGAEWTLLRLRIAGLRRTHGHLRPMDWMSWRTRSRATSRVSGASESLPFHCRVIRARQARVRELGVAASPLAPLFDEFRNLIC